MRVFSPLPFKKSVHATEQGSKIQMIQRTKEVTFRANLLFISRTRHWEPSHEYFLFLFFLDVRVHSYFCINEILSTSIILPQNPSDILLTGASDNDTQVPTVENVNSTEKTFFISSQALAWNCPIIWAFLSNFWKSTPFLLSMLSLVTGCVNPMSGYFFSKQSFQDITDSVMRNAAHKACG